MTLRKKGAAALMTCLLTAGVFSGCSQFSTEESGKSGQGVNIETTIFEKVNQTIQGKQVENDTLIKTLYQCNIVNKDKDNNVEVKVTMKSVYIKEEKNDKDNKDNKDKKITNEYDSVNGLNITDPLASPIITVYSGAAGESFNAIFDEKGNVKEIKGVNELDKKILDKLKINDTKTKSSLESVVDNEFDERALKDKLQNMIINQIVNKKVSTGDSWSNKEKVNIGTEISMNTDYKVSKVNNNIYYIDMDGKTRTGIRSELIENEGMQYTYSGSLGESGNLEVDKDTGIISKSSILSKFDGTMEVEDGPKSLKGKFIPTSIEVQVYINLKK